MGWGINSERICVTIGPSVPASTMVSPSRSFPLTKIASIVVPKPEMAFTSNTVACIKTQEKEETFFQTMVK